MKAPFEKTAAERPWDPAWRGPVDIAAALVSMACLIAAVDIEVLEDRILPLGVLLSAWAFIWMAWRALRRRVDRDLAWVALAGVLSGALTVAVLWHLYRIPWLFACIGCLARHAWFSVAVTFGEGFGFGAIAVLFLRRAAGARPVRLARTQAP